MEWFTNSLYHAAAMLWEMTWALVLGFTISAVLQVFVSKGKMVKLFGHNGLKEVLLAMSFGAASSSCSYAAAATTKTIFKKGAAFVPSLAFMIASTNLVVELGIVLCLLMGWRFLLAELAGAFVMVGVVWVIFTIYPPKDLISAARENREKKEEDGHHHASESGQSKQIMVANAFFMDVSMLWKEIVIGVFLAGFLMVLVPKDWWQAIFVSHGSYSLRLIENALVGPLIALASFVCSVGNIPLASILWMSGASFGGVIAFLYGDLIVLPLIFAYRKYYGFKAALYITGVLYAGMVVAGILVDLVFNVAGLTPHGGPAQSAMMQAGFSWNHTTWLNIAAILGGGYLTCLHFKSQSGERHVHSAHEHHHVRQGHHAH